MCRSIGLALSFVSRRASLRTPRAIVTAMLHPTLPFPLAQRSRRK